MYKIAIVAAFTLVLASSVLAQDTSRLQLEGGYMYDRYYPISSVGTNCSGGSGQVDYFFIHSVAAVADFGGCAVTNLASIFGSGTDAHASLFLYQFGPKFAWRSNKMVEPFAQVLFGGIQVTASRTGGGGDTLTANGNAFAMTAGGGVDIRLTHMIAIRGQGEYLLTHGGGTIQNGLQINAGVVFRFGGH